MATISNKNIDIVFKEEYWPHGAEVTEVGGPIEEGDWVIRIPTKRDHFGWAEEGSPVKVIKVYLDRDSLTLQGTQIKTGSKTWSKRYFTRVVPSGYVNTGESVFPSNVQLEMYSEVNIWPKELPFPQSPEELPLFAASNSENHQSIVYGDWVIRKFEHRDSISGISWRDAAPHRVTRVDEGGLYVHCINRDLGGSWDEDKFIRVKSPAEVYRTIAGPKTPLPAKDLAPQLSFEF